MESLAAYLPKSVKGKRILITDERIVLPESTKTLRCHHLADQATPADSVNNF
jgi:hypothetical protein